MVLRAPVPASHSLILQSTLPEAMVEPQGLKATLVTLSVCPIKVLLNEESHSLILWFLLPDAKRKPDDMGKIRKNHPQNIERNYFGYIMPWGNILNLIRVRNGRQRPYLDS